jgi:hypothetical protein
MEDHIGVGDRREAGSVRVQQVAEVTLDRDHPAVPGEVSRNLNAVDEGDPVER